MKYKFRPRHAPSEITSAHLYYSRRRFLSGLALLPLSQTLAALPASAAALPATVNPKYTLEKMGYDALTPEVKALSYNNFYELGTDKEAPKMHNNWYQSTPWQVSIEGEVHNPRTFDIDDLRQLAPMEERVYRLRCVEAWSMVLPWIGYSFSHLIEAVRPTANAKYVQFLTFNPEDKFPDKKNDSLPWPYTEGLRMDEAMHPLTLFAFGIYGEELPVQSGAPVRMIIPWKYGFKSGKALDKIIFRESMPLCTWNILQPSEYGFYANVNPAVSHPRWSQASEKMITSSIFPERRPTDKFNGFADEVASLYSDMDLTQNF